MTPTPISACRSSCPHEGAAEEPDCVLPAYVVKAPSRRSCVAVGPITTDRSPWARLSDLACHAPATPIHDHQRPGHIPPCCGSGTGGGLGASPFWSEVVAGAPGGVGKLSVCARLVADMVGVAGASSGPVWSGSI